MHYVYVLDRAGKPLMPTTRYGWVYRALKSGRAKPVTTVPFTIRLTYDPVTCVKQPVTLGNDPGRTNIGLAAVTDTGRCLYSAHCETRNKEIPGLMSGRRGYRQASRRGERLARKRLAKRLGTTMKAVMERMLPGYEKPVPVKDIINTEARFNNRKRPAGWLTPTARQLLQTHLNLVNLVMKILPVTRIALEMNRFAFMALENKGIRHWDYQKGPLYGYEGLHDAVSEQQGGKCLLCGKKEIEHYHHIVPRYRNGSNTIGNIAGLCSYCHDLVHKDAEAAKKLEAKKAGMNKKYHALSVLNQIIPYLAEELYRTFGDNFFVTNGWDTKRFRKDNHIEKDHDIDAYCIACSTLEGRVVLDVPENSFEIRQFRRHDRANIHRQTERVYKFDGKTVAKNRRKRTEQKGDSLAEWYENTVEKHGKREADQIRSKLTVRKSTRSYNTPERILPGTVFAYQGKRHVMTGQLTGGMYLRTDGYRKNFPARDCKIISQNAGLVYIA